MSRSDRPAAPSKADPRPGGSPGYDETHPRHKDEVPRHQPDARGADFGKLPNPEIGHVDRKVGADPDPTAP